MQQRTFAVFAVLLALTSATADRLLGQADRGTITGTVTDPTQAAVPGAEVTATNEATGIASTTVTGTAGNYTIPLLPIGSYTITSSLRGFRTHVRNGVPVPGRPDDSYRHRLEVGQLRSESR
jgi:hypothetical protein